MKRVYTGWKNSLAYFVSNEALSFLTEGIQSNGGEIISIELTPISGIPSIVERILILYEDHNNYDKISDFLKGKEDNTTLWIKKFKGR